MLDDAVGDQRALRRFAAAAQRLVAVAPLGEEAVGGQPVGAPILQRPTGDRRLDEPPADDAAAIRREQTQLLEVIAGRDPQLERAVDEALRLLKEKPVQRRTTEPAPPSWGKRPGGH